MKVQIKPLKGDTFEVEYEPDTLVKDLKDKIAELKPDMPADVQKLIFQGKILNNDSPMKEYGMKEGDFLVVMVAKVKPPAAAAAPAPAPTPAAAPEAAPAAPTGGDAQQMAASAMPTGAAGMETQIEQLMQMGFERPQVENCLRAAFGNPDRAVEYLMSGIPDNVRAMVEPAGGAPPPGGDAPPPAAPPATGGGGPSPFPAMPTGGDTAFPAMPTGGGGGGGGDADLPPALAQLRNSPQFAQLAQIVASNPGALQRMLPSLAQSHPEAAQAVQENPEAFMRMLMEASAGGGGGGGMPGMGGGGGMPGLPAGMDPAMMAQALQSNPELLNQIASEIEQQDPALAQQIRTNPAALGQLMQAVAQQGGGGMPGMGGPPGGHVVQLTPQEDEAVKRLQELGFDRNLAAQAYLACDKNEELAANYLFEHGADDA